MMPARDHKRLERLVAALHHAESEGAAVRWDDEIDGRQFDVTVRFKYGLHSYLTVIECKDSSRLVSVDKIDAFVTKARDVRANKAIVIASAGFQDGCAKVADRHGIKLLVLTESFDTVPNDLVGEISPALNVYDVQFVKSDGRSLVDFGDGARLGYLMQKAILHLDEGPTAPADLITRWQMTGPDISTKDESEVELPLPKAVQLTVPLQGPEQVTHMRFRCRFIEARLVSQPCLDMHVQEALASRVELRDPTGNLEHSAQLADLALGFDDPMQAGQFYLHPATGFHYYCRWIDENRVRLFLVESYQHGELVRADLTMDKKFMDRYVRVTDDKTLTRLRELLRTIPT